MKGEGSEGLCAGERYQQASDTDNQQDDADRNREDLERRRVRQQGQAEEEQKLPPVLRCRAGECAHRLVHESWLLSRMGPILTGGRLSRNVGQAS